MHVPLIPFGLSNLFRLQRRVSSHWHHWLQPGTDEEAPGWLPLATYGFRLWDLSKFFCRMKPVELFCNYNVITRYRELAQTDRILGCVMNDSMNTFFSNQKNAMRIEWGWPVDQGAGVRVPTQTPRHSVNEWVWHLGIWKKEKCQAKQVGHCRWKQSSKEVACFWRMRQQTLPTWSSRQSNWTISNPSCVLDDYHSCCN